MDSWPRLMLSVARSQCGEAKWVKLRDRTQKNVNNPVAVGNRVTDNFIENYVITMT